MSNISYGILKIPGKQCRGVVIEVLDHYMQQPWRARWGNKVIEHGRTICSTLTAGDWPIGPCQRISPNPYILFYKIINNIIPVHRLFLNPRYGERSTSTYPVPPESWCQCWPILYILYKLSNPQCSFPPGYHHGLCSQNKLPRLRSSSQSTLRSLHLTLHDGTSIRLPSTYRGSIDVFW